MYYIFQLKLNMNNMCTIDGYLIPKTFYLPRAVAPEAQISNACHFALFVETQICALYSSYGANT